MVQSSGQKRQPEINRGVYLNIFYAVLDLPETELFSAFSIFFTRKHLNHLNLQCFVIFATGQIKFVRVIQSCIEYITLSAYIYLQTSNLKLSNEAAETTNKIFFIV